MGLPQTSISKRLRGYLTQTGWAVSVRGVGYFVADRIPEPPADEPSWQEWRADIDEWRRTVESRLDDLTRDEDTP